MVQRSPTLVVKIETLHDIATGIGYSERALAAGVDAEKADYMGASMPYKLMGESQKPLYEKMRERDAEFYRQLTDAGFVIDWGDDETGLFMKYMRRGAGYYIDIGGSQLIIDGKIKHKYGQVDHLTENSVVLDDGAELPADLVVYATGFGSMNGWVADIIDQETADKVGRVWGLGSGTKNDPGPWEGEPRNMWKPTRQEALWFHGGNLHQSRHNSLFLALQLKARLEGIPTPVYGLQEVYHKS
jgi:putative flavoprotein involved in K+ transport